MALEDAINEFKIYLKNNGSEAFYNNTELTDKINTIFKKHLKYKYALLHSHELDIPLKLISHLDNIVCGIKLCLYILQNDCGFEHKFSETIIDVWIELFDLKENLGYMISSGQKQYVSIKNQPNISVKYVIENETLIQMTNGVNLNCYIDYLEICNIKDIKKIISDAEGGGEKSQYHLSYLFSNANRLGYYKEWLGNSCIHSKFMTNYIDELITSNNLMSQISSLNISGNNISNDKLDVILNYHISSAKCNMIKDHIVYPIAFLHVNNKQHIIQLRPELDMSSKLNMFDKDIRSNFKSIYPDYVIIVMPMTFDVMNILDIALGKAITIQFISSTIHKTVILPYIHDDENIVFKDVFTDDINKDIENKSPYYNLYEA